MARNYRVLARMPMDGALPENDIINTWHFQHDDFAPLTTPSDSANDMFDQLAAFYTGIDGVILSSAIANTVEFKAYDLADPEPRVPIATRSVALAPLAVTSLPHEDACVLSFRADPISGVKAASLRGRVYLGPLGTSAVSPQTGGVRLTTSVIIAVVDAAVAAFHTGLTTADPFLSVFSPTRLANGASLDLSVRHVQFFKIDNGVDTQRRRGMAADSRQERVLPGR